VLKYVIITNGEPSPHSVAESLRAKGYIVEEGKITPDVVKAADVVVAASTVALGETKPTHAVGALVTADLPSADVIPAKEPSKGGDVIPHADKMAPQKALPTSDQAKAAVSASALATEGRPTVEQTKERAQKERSHLTGRAFGY
jgi:hypothetical protein